MEKIKSICVMRELVKALSELESQLLGIHGVSLNEAMVLCCIDHGTVTASVISENVGLSHSNTSKVLKSLEAKDLITRSIGETDRRHMRFNLTDSGKLKLKSLKKEDLKIPAFILPLFEI